LPRIIQGTNEYCQIDSGNAPTRCPDRVGRPAALSRIPAGERKRPGVMRRTGLLLLCAVAALLAGCGRADDDRAVAAVTARFLQAVGAHDGTRACAYLSGGTREALEHDEGKRCAEAVVELDVDPSPVRRMQVFGVGAKVDLADGDSAFLELTPRGWRLSAAGCEPGAGDEPYTCEVEA
jgi:hypothetical protein